MNERINKIIEELKVKIVYDECLENDGYYIALLNIIVINNKLSDALKVRVLLHELAHAAIHQDNYLLYRLAYSLRSKMENEAEEFMISETFESFIDSGLVDLSDINSINFLEQNDFSTNYEPFVNNLIKRKLIGI